MPGDPAKESEGGYPSGMVGADGCEKARGATISRHSIYENDLRTFSRLPLPTTKKP